MEGTAAIALFPAMPFLHFRRSDVPKTNAATRPIKFQVRLPRHVADAIRAEAARLGRPLADLASLRLCERYSTEDQAALNVNK